MQTPLPQERTQADMQTNLGYSKLWELFLQIRVTQSENEIRNWGDSDLNI